MTDIELASKLFLVLMRASSSVMKVLEEDIKQYGLNPTEFSVLELLYHKGDLPIQKIGEKVLLASSSLTYVVDKLEKKAFLERLPCPTDRRVTFAALTPISRAFFSEIFPKHEQALATVMGGLNAQEKDILIKQLKKMGLYAANLLE